MNKNILFEILSYKLRNYFYNENYKYLTCNSNESTLVKKSIVELNNKIYTLKEQENEESEEAEEDIKKVNDEQYKDVIEDSMAMKKMVLKSLYDNLVELNYICDKITDKDFDEIKEKIKNALKIYELILDNLKDFRNNLDEIIKNYENFILNITTELNNLFEENK